MSSVQLYVVLMAELYVSNGRIISLKIDSDALIVNYLRTLLSNRRRVVAFLYERSKFVERDVGQ